VGGEGLQGRGVFVYLLHPGDVVKTRKGDQQAKQRAMEHVWRNHFAPKEMLGSTLGDGFIDMWDQNRSMTAQLGPLGDGGEFMWKGSNWGVGQRGVEEEPLPKAGPCWRNKKKEGFLKGKPDKSTHGGTGGWWDISREDKGGWRGRGTRNVLNI